MIRLPCDAGLVVECGRELVARNLARAYGSASLRRAEGVRSAGIRDVRGASTAV